MNAKEETTLRQKINEQHQTSWNSASIADSAGSILCIGRPNKRLIILYQGCPNSSQMREPV
jgi:hypothetical protein